MFLVNSLPPSPHLFSQVRILKNFKSFVFGSADSTGVTGVFCGSADSKGFMPKKAFETGEPEDRKRAGDVRISS